jgi:hypothetical protein
MIQVAGKLMFGGVPSGMLDTPETATGKLVVLSAETGEPIASHDLDSAVRWDGMAAADGKLYVVTENGELQCWE